MQLLRSLIQDRAARVGVTTVALFTVLALVSPYLGIRNPYEQSVHTYSPPSLRHLLGTDHLGRETLGGVIWGSRVSLTFGFVVAVLSGLVGMVLGALSGYYGGLFDDILSRFIEVFIAVPPLFVIILIVSLFGSSLTLTMVVVGILIWPSNARIMRAQVLSIRRREYVFAAVAAGATDLRILLRHVLPNSLGPLVANSTLQVGFAIGLEAGLSFLGLGDPNVISWGQMLYVSQTHYRNAWWMVVFPGLCVAAAVLGFNLVGDALGKWAAPGR